MTLGGGLAHFLMKDEEKAREAFNQEFHLEKKGVAEFVEFVDQRGGAQTFDPELIEKQRAILAAPDLATMEMLWNWLTFLDGQTWGDRFQGVAQNVFRFIGDRLASDRLLAWRVSFLSRMNT